MDQLKRFLLCSVCGLPMKRALTLPCRGAHRVCVSCVASHACKKCGVCNQTFRKPPVACLLTSHVARAVHGDVESEAPSNTDTARAWLHAETVEIARKFEHLMRIDKYAQKVHDTPESEWVRCECCVQPYVKSGFICIVQRASKTGKLYYACPRLRQDQCRFFRFKV